ncbi:MAG TPA: hypothetical protein VMU05_13845 [Dongiaceae bacterium]|nr:hypothetical protein [Dongiaceae bacterium]
MAKLHPPGGGPQALHRFVWIDNCAGVAYPFSAANYPESNGG